MKNVIQYTINVDRSRFPDLSTKEIHDVISNEIIHMMKIGEERVVNRLKDEQGLRTYKKMKSFLEGNGE